MKPTVDALKPPDSHHLSAAQGWLMLKDHRSALEELDAISPACQMHSDVLELRWQCCAAARDWSQCLMVAETIIQSAPREQSGWVHRSYSLHELKRTREALENLLPLARKYPQEPIIAYNLACYASQLGDLKEARRWLRQALRAGDPAKIRKMALDDADLKALWREIPSLKA